MPKSNLQCVDQMELKGQKSCWVGGSKIANTNDQPWRVVWWPNGWSYNGQGFHSCESFYTQIVRVHLPTTFFAHFSNIGRSSCFFYYCLLDGEDHQKPYYNELILIPKIQTLNYRAQFAAREILYKLIKYFNIIFGGGSLTKAEL